MENKKENYEMVNHPSHYKKYDVEVLDMIERIWGTYIAAVWCEITAFKYRMRLGEKPDNPIEQDLKKESFYLDKHDELMEKVNNKQDIIVDNSDFWNGIYKYAKETTDNTQYTFNFDTVSEF